MQFECIKFEVKIHASSPPCIKPKEADINCYNDKCSQSSMLSIVFSFYSTRYEAVQLQLLLDYDDIESPEGTNLL